jgi:hypothetical protein
MPQIANAPAEDGVAPPATSLFVTAQDGLRLHVRDYGARLARVVPVVCLPGLARTAADSKASPSLSSAGQRRVFAPRLSRAGEIRL